MNVLIKLQVNKTNKFFVTLYVKDWFEEIDLPYFIQKKDYVVGYFYDYHDGEKSNIEGLTTLAICKKIDDAKIIMYKNFNLNKTK